MSDYMILSLDSPVAKWERGCLTVINEQLLPLFLKRVANADMWLETRAIDSHRANSRLLKKALRLTERDDVSTVLHVNGATITDNYWIKPLDSDLTYEQIRFDNDYFSRLALKGTYDSFNRAANSKHSKTPELTNIGSFEKCWKLIDGKWWMYKSANHSEQFTELLEFIKRTRKEDRIGLNFACEGFLGGYEEEVRDSFYMCQAGISVGSILSDGSISACPSIRSKFYQGNIYKDDFWDIWNNRFEMFRDREWAHKGICASCDMFKYCRGNGMHLHDEEGKLLVCHYNRITK